jgi:hypothetical protein
MYTTEIIDNIIEECANIFLDVLKDIGMKITTSHFTAFGHDKIYIGIKVPTKLLISV